MARSFNGSTDKIVAASTINFNHNNPFSISAWVILPDNPGDNQAIIGNLDAGAGTYRGWEIRKSQTGGFIGFFLISTYPTNAIETGGNIAVPNNVLCHVGTSYSGNDLASGVNCYVNSVVGNGSPAFNTLGANTTTNSILPRMGQRSDATSPIISTGQIAEIGIWDAELTAGEFASLAKGYSPLFIRPTNLVSYWPLIGRTSPEIELIGANGGTLTGTTTVPHPRVIMPSGPGKLKTVVGVVYVYMRPDADQSGGSWLNELGTNVNLFASVDETVASDTDYIQSSTTSGDKVRLQLSDPGSGVAQPFDIRYRASGVSGTATLVGRLYQGVTLIDSWNHTVDTTPTDYTHTLGSTEFALITDFNDLFIEFEYVT